MATLWDEALALCVQRLRESGEDQHAVDQFLRDKASLEEAQQSAVALQTDSDRKYGQNESRGKGVSAKWIRRIMENLDKFVTFGNFAMASAPQSVGLAWFAICQVLNAVQRDYTLYGTFSTGLNDITEMMVLIKTYDKLYRSSSIGNDGGIYEELCKGIRELYASILDFSYAVKKYITGGKRAKAMHALKDIVGASNRVFEGKTAAIQAQKTIVVQSAEAAFQQKTSDNLGNVSGELNSIHSTMQDFLQLYKQSSNEWKEILSELKTAKSMSPREVAFAEYEKNLKALSPWLDQSSTLLAANLQEQEAGTCQWVADVPEFSTWRTSEENPILCFTGEVSSGKSVTAASIYESLTRSADKTSLIQYVSQDSSAKDSSEVPIDRIENTIFRDLYRHALDESEDDLLLQRCNNVFAHPKQAKSKAIADRNKKLQRPGARAHPSDSNGAPDLLDTYPSLVETLQKRVYLIVDAANVLSEDNQTRFVDRMLELRSNSSIKIHILLVCRSSSQVQMKMREAKVAQISVSENNEDDIRLVIRQGVEKIPNLSDSEKKEIEEAIKQKTGHRIRYVKQVALPFLNTPLQRPVSKWLEDLPKNINETYNQHLQQLTPSYRRLLETALAWVLFASLPPTVDEIMEAHSHLYLQGDTSTQIKLNEDSLNLYSRQIQQAGGPFLDIRDGRFVVLQDAQAVRDFCTSAESSTPDMPSEEPSCANCKPRSKENTALISEKREQLNLAITCLKHLNSTSFQKRFLADHLVEAEKRAKVRLGLEGLPASERATINGENTDGDVSDPSEKAPGEDSSEKGNEGEGDESTQTENVETNGKAARDEDEPKSEGIQEEEVDDDESTFSDQDDDFYPSDYGVIGNNNQTRTVRYEILKWPEHVRQAEALWPSEERTESPEWQELMAEMEKFFLTSVIAFEAWKLEGVPYNREPWDPIFFAVTYGLTSLTKFLLDKGIQVMGKTPGGYSALAVASEAPNNLEMLRLLLSRGGDPNLEDATIPPFHDWIIYDASAECVEEFLRHGASCTKKNETEQLNVLHYLGMCGTNEKVLDLILDAVDEKGDHVDINILDNNDETALHHLLRRREIPIKLLQRFLARGADVNLDNKDSERPLYESASWGDNEAIETFIGKVTKVDDDEKRGRTALHAAAWTANKDGIELILAAGADINRKDGHNRTPLLFSCLHHFIRFAPEGAHEATAERLVNEQIKRGATFEEINVPTKRGRTPLREASGRGFVQVVAAILGQMKDEKDKAWINKRDDRRGRTPLHSAAAHGRGDVVELLLKHGADPSLRDGENRTGMTCLELCLDRWSVVGSKRYEEAISHVISASVEEAKSNSLLLTTAAIYGSIPVLEKLSQVGVNLDTPDPYGWTPRQLAAQFEHIEAEKVIRRTIAARALRPTKWVLESTVSSTMAEEEGLKVSHNDGDAQLCVLADRPIPADSVFFYFETEILDWDTAEPRDNPTPGNQNADIIALGFCTTSSTKLLDFPGWAPLVNAPNAKSWAYHGDDGGFFASHHSMPLQFGPHYGPGDTIGCGVHVEAQKIFFTRNGIELVDHHFENIKGRLFPVLGFKDKMKIRTNFGNDPSKPFKWAETADKIQQV